MGGVTYFFFVHCLESSYLCLLVAGVNIVQMVLFAQSESGISNEWLNNSVDRRAKLH